MNNDLKMIVDDALIRSLETINPNLLRTIRDLKTLRVDAQTLRAHFKAAGASGLVLLAIEAAIEEQR